MNFSGGLVPHLRAEPFLGRDKLAPFEGSVGRCRPSVQGRGPRDQPAGSQGPLDPFRFRFKNISIFPKSKVTAYGLRNSCPTMPARKKPNEFSHGNGPSKIP